MVQFAVNKFEFTAWFGVELIAYLFLILSLSVFVNDEVEISNKLTETEVDNLKAEIKIKNNFIKCTSSLF